MRPITAMTAMTSTANRRRRQRGSTIMEFALVGPALILLFFGTVGTGITLGRYTQALSICRDLAHMYADGVDFSQTQNQNIAVQLAQGTGMTVNGGTGVVIFTRISTVYQADCDASGYTASCGNLGRAVITQRLTVGNAAMKVSAFGTPTAGLMDSLGNISPSVYLQNTDSSVQATNFTPLLTNAGATQQQGDAAYVVEVYLPYADVSFLGFSTPPGAYVSYIF
jgi:Flp pilus assembly protein TadG